MSDSRPPHLPALSRLAAATLVLLTGSGLAYAAPAADRAGVSRLPASLSTAAPAASTLRALALPAVDVDTLRAEDAIHDQLGMPYRYAVLHSVDLDNRRHGAWTTLADGRAIWRLRLQSPGAESLHLGIDRLALPAGATLWLRSLDGRTLQGPWTRDDRNAAGGLWTPVVLGDDAVLELDLPSGLSAAVRRRTLVRVTAVGHGYRGFADGGEKQLSCNIDTVCPDADPWRNQVRSTARISFTEGGGSFLCTGTLLNNSAGDFRPYFLTANHCISGTGGANTTVVYWNYQSPNCGQLGGGALNQTQSGAQLRATFEPSDFTLIELNAKPAASRQVYYSGWNATGQVPSGGVGIHHPRGEEKSIAFENSPLRDDGDYWRVNAWDRGTTEQGSSGSCVWDPADGRCVGMLSFGTAGCNTIDSYGKISRGWEGGGTPDSRLRDWLDPRGQGTRVLDGADPAGGGSGACTAGSLCLLGGRYEAKVTWVNQYAPGQSGNGIPLPQTDFTGFFAFTDAANVELIVKILDFGGGVIKVFYGQLTDLQFTLTVRETATGRTKTYRNTTGNCGGIDQSFKSQAVAVLPVIAPAGDAPQANCRQDADTLCLLDRRFAVEATWRNPYAANQSGNARTPSTALSRLSGVFNYGDANNVELLVKTLDFGDRILFIWGALSDFEYTIRVRDTNTGVVNTYFNPGGKFCGGLDADAF
jgi:hypothetical protein